MTERADLGTSWTSVIIGWAVALGVSLLLSAIVGAIVGAIFSALGGSSAATGGGMAGLIGLLLTLLIAFFVGGYVAGRMASRQGLKHGLLVAVVALVVKGDPGDHRRRPGARLRRPALRRNAARPGQQRRGASPATGPERDPERLWHPGVALPVYRGSTWRSQRCRYRPATLLGGSSPRPWRRA